MLCTKYGVGQAVDCAAHTLDSALCNNPQIGCAILRAYPRKCAKHGLMTNPWIAQMSNPRIAPKEVSKE